MWWRWDRKQTKYTRVDEEYSALDFAEQRAQVRFTQTRTALLISAACIAVLLIFGAVHMRFFSPSLETINHCTKPAIRREWRMLNDTEKRAYLDAVKCLSTHSSHLGLNTTLYDDFPYTHSHIGADSHKTVGFLPWHRYFLQIYENTLREKCGYAHGLTYWDWSLDWKDIRRSPVWDEELGFGGDGNKTGEIIIDRGRCLTDGPFAGLRPAYYRGQYHPHCLSRGFLEESKFLHQSGRVLKPKVLENVLNQTGYTEFFLMLENGPHNALPYGVGGDFFRFTAPNEPVFFLHHAQLDRLWWTWQQKDTGARVHASDSNDGVKSAYNFSLDTTVDMHGLAPNVPVGDLLDVSSGVLCYEYDS